MKIAFCYATTRVSSAMVVFYVIIRIAARLRHLHIIILLWNIEVFAR